MPELLFRHLGSLEFTDGIWRDVFEDAAGRQFIDGDDRQPLYGLWMIPRDEADVPLVVNS